MPHTIDDAIADIASLSLSFQKPWHTIRGVPHFEPYPGMLHSLAFALINDGIEPTAGNRPDEDDIGFSDEYRDAFSIVISHIGRYKGWFLSLIACQQIRPLDEMNIRVFFHGNGICDQGAESLLKIIQYCAFEQPLYSSNAELRVEFEDNRFFEYHTSAMTTTSLVTRAINSCPIADVFTLAEISSVHAAKEAPNDIELVRSIPEHTLFKARAVLEALNISHPKWSRGQRAWESGDPNVYKALVKAIADAATPAIDMNINGGIPFGRHTSLYEDLEL